MPYWGWILLIVGLSILAVAIVFANLHHTHRRMPARQAAQGGAEDVSAPLPMHVATELDAMTGRELEEERLRADSFSATDSATYEIVLPDGAGSVTAVVSDLPPAVLGEVLFHQGHFWRVDAIEPAQSRNADGRLIVSPTTDEPKPTAA